MTANHNPPSTATTAPTDEPADVPAGRATSLSRLEPLLGVWDMEATFDAGYFGPDSPAVTSREGRTVFEWLSGGHFLLQHFTVDNPAAPSGLAVIGATSEDDGTFSQDYYDSRGVARVYQMHLDNNIWTLTRHAPGFCQRYTGTISDDRQRITGAWDHSPDGINWRHDFALNYIATTPISTPGSAKG